MLSAPHDRGYILAVGLALSVSQWALAYVCRFPAVTAPGWVMICLLLGVIIPWGWVAGRTTGDGFRAGLLVGAASAVVNLLILGSLLSSAASGRIVPSALLWVPGSIAAQAVIAGLAALLASHRGIRSDAWSWTALLSKVAVTATFLLVIAGGLVTSAEEGLAVVDWPNTFGMNMFLYPLSRMTGGIFYEHAHRLFGSLVGLVTISLALWLWRREPRTRVKLLGFASLAAVATQGILGGLRVTGRFTLSTSPDEVAPSIVLAILHGILGQLILASLVVLAVVTSVAWWRHPPAVTPQRLGSDRTLQLWLVVTLVAQLVFGALQRHVETGVTIHVSLAAIVTLLAVLAGARVWILYPTAPPLPRLGQLLLSVVSLQVVLGIVALGLTRGEAVVGNPSMLEITLATAHQACGAALLMVAVALLVWTRRLLRVE